MKIKSIEIENFRSIVEAKFQVNDFNIFVGQNNCGKTNFFEAIEYFFNGLGRGADVNDLKFKRDSTKKISVKIEFSGAQEGASKMLNQANKTKIQNALNGEDTVTMIRNSEDAKRKMFVNGSEVVPGTGFDAALNDFFPKFEYVNTKQYYDAVAKYNKTSPVGIMLSGVLATILEQNEQYKEFQAKFKELFENEDSEIRAEFDNVGDKVRLYLEKQFPDCVSVKFEVTPPIFDDLLKNFDTTIDDGIETLAEEKGDGMQRALMLAIIQAYADFRKTNSDSGKSFLFFIDEAELHLHPTAQRNLKNVLHALSQDDDQVFINTHSSVFVADDSTGQMILKVEKNVGETSIEETQPDEKPYVVYDLLGGSPSDLLLPKNFIVVEGQSEFELLTRVIKRFYGEKPAVQIIKANGDVDQVERTINAIEQSFKPLSASIYKERAVILIDKPSSQRQAGVNDFKRANSHLATNNQMFELTARDVEQCYPSQVDPTYGNWKKSQTEVDAMNGHKKKQLAKFVGDNITQQQFENDMAICFSALEKVWELAY
ncbi:MAG: AAA family ATPase [Patescibacteria group bacterium]